MESVNEFLRHMHDIVVLLGGDRRFAELLNHPELITARDVDDLRRYSVQLLDATKDKLLGVNTRTVTVRGA
jgi:hypothetical protein